MTPDILFSRRPLARQEIHHEYQSDPHRHRRDAVVALACAAAFAACNTVKGVGTDIQKAGEAGSKALD